MKEVKLCIQFPDKYSINSVIEDLNCKLSDLIAYWGFKIGVERPHPCLVSDEELERIRNEGETFFDW